jgi:DNA-binding SARP family transcriptional activator
VRVWRGEVELALGPPKQRATLGLLLAAGGQPVTFGQMLDVLWEDEPAVTAVNQVHRYIGMLRRVFEPDLKRRGTGRWLLPTGSGYRLAVDAASCDLLRLRGLVTDALEARQAGASAEATQLLVQAMAIAAAPPADEEFRNLPLVVAIEAERVRAAVTAAEQALLCGMAADVLPALRGIAAEHVFDETVQVMLMRCLHAAGRPWEALESYDRVRDRLRQELGADPGPALVAAHQAILTQPSGPSPASDPVNERPAQLPAATPAFAGRCAALAALDDSERRVRVISGMAGVGKTTLALHWAHLHAEAYPDGQLYVDLRGFDASGHAVEPADALRDLLSALGVPPAALPDGIEARAAALRTLLSTRRVLILLDNASDFRQVQPLLPGSTDSLVIITSRNRLTKLIALDTATAIPLEPFTSDEAHHFLTQRLGAARTDSSPAATERIHDACGGLPLALAVVAARGVVNPRFPLELLAGELCISIRSLDLVVDEDAGIDVREVLSWSYRALPPDARLTLGALAVHPGPEISIAAAVSLTALPPARIRAALTALTAASLLRESTPGRFAFHDLVRRYALDETDTDTRAVTARLIDHYVRSVRAAYLRHGRPPLVPLDPPIDGVCPEESADIADSVRWYRCERSVLQAVVHRAADVGAYRAVLLLTLDWRPMSQIVDPPSDMLPFVRLALDAAGKVDEPALVAECHRDAAAKFGRFGDLATARALFHTAEAMFEELGDLTGQANTLRNLAITATTDIQERVWLTERAVGLARRGGVPLVLSTALSAYGQMLWRSGQIDMALSVLAEGLAIAQENAGGEPLAVELMTAMAKAHAAAGDIPNAIEAGERALAALKATSDITIEMHLLADHGDALLATGQIEQARQAWERYLVLSADTGFADSVAQETGVSASEAVHRVRQKLAALPPNIDT